MRQTHSHYRLEAIMEEMVKTSMTKYEIITEFKKKGKETLNKVSEFFGVKKKFEKIRDNVR